MFNSPVPYLTVCRFARVRNLDVMFPGFPPALLHLLCMSICRLFACSGAHFFSHADCNFSLRLPLLTPVVEKVSGIAPPLAHAIQCTNGGHPSHRRPVHVEPLRILCEHSVWYIVAHSPAQELTTLTGYQPYVFTYIGCPETMSPKDAVALLSVRSATRPRNPRRRTMFPLRR